MKLMITLQPVKIEIFYTSIKAFLLFLQTKSNSISKFENLFAQKNLYMKLSAKTFE